MQLSKEQRVFVVTKFLQSGSIRDVQALFEEHFPDRPSPTKTTIWRNVKKYQTEGTSLNINKGRSGRKRTRRTDENIELVRQHLQENHNVSCRKNGLDMDRTTFHRIVKHEIKFYPYKMHYRHELLPNDLHRRRNFCNWFLQKPIGFEDMLIIGDEAAFHLNGRVNNHNVRHYAPRNAAPEFNFDVGVSREKVSVWMGLCGSGDVIGPIFFEGNLTGNAYLNILDEQIIPELRRIHGNRMNRMWWIQDGAPCHRTIPVRNLLNDVFNTRIIAVNHEVEWPPRSPDLTPCDFFLWGYLKSKVYSTPPANAQELREKIFNEAQLLKEDPQVIKRVVGAMRKKLDLCLRRDGAHVEGNGRH